MEGIRTFSAFVNDSLIASGPLEAVLPALKTRFDSGAPDLVLVFEDQTGRQMDFDLRGSLAEVLARVAPAPSRPGPGRPKLGVVSREISLLPRHWEWLEAQPNGASAALRGLIEQASRQESPQQRSRRAMEATGRFLTAMAGNLPNYEEASRALYRAARPRFEELSAIWPADIRDHARRLAASVWEQG